jgi:hypothetical protein
MATGRDDMEFVVDLSVNAKIELNYYIETNRLQGRTQLTSSRPKPLLFENCQGHPSHAFERVTQDHPLIRFVTEQLSKPGRAAVRFPVSAIELPAFKVQGFKPGIYVFSVHRWQVTGTRDIERLEYVARQLNGGGFIDSEQSEHLVNIAAIEGQQWLGAPNDVDTAEAGHIFSDCLDESANRFSVFRDAQGREDRDRLAMMKNALRAHLDKQADRLIQTIRSYRDSGSESRIRLIPAVEGKLKKLRNRISERIAELEIKSGGKPEEDFVSGGVIHLL